MYKFLDSNLFQTIVILIVGLFAFVNYIWGKKDEQRKAANIIVMEIRDIEKQIERIKSADKYFNSNPVITTNSWDKYKYLFSKILDDDEYTLIGDVYKNATLIEEFRKHASDQITASIMEKAILIPKISSEISLKHSGDKNAYTEEFNRVFECFTQEVTLYESYMIRDHIRFLSNNYTNATTTSAGLKLKTIANKRLFFVF
ncbi:hypothetical protein ABNX05_25205 [Lysinibacillus sp. M3]|uniref:Uncharacterized protein n=1 Tax=Lysinibacillus zambalensis TaxID=3160866 RepID=A0ABV1N257_9BACI